MKSATSILVTALAAAGLVAAEDTTTVSLLFPFEYEGDVVASVISAGPTATDYYVSCPTDAPSDECGIGMGFSLRNGPEVLTYSMYYEGEYTWTMTASCSLDPAKDRASCFGTTIRDDEKTISAEEIVGYKSQFLPVTITAGADKLKAVPTGGSDSDSNGPAETAAPTATAGSGPQPTAAESTNAAFPRITQNAVVMGAAALVGGVMML